MRTQFSKFILAVAFSLATALTFFACSSEEPPPLSPSGGEQSYSYCIMANNNCIVGPFTANTCNGQPSNSCPSSSSRTIIPSSSSKAAVQEYCVFRSFNSNYSDICGVIEPIGSDHYCRVGTKMDYCPYGNKKMKLDFLYSCVDACPYLESICSSKCGGQINIGNGRCGVLGQFCRYIF